MSNEMAPKSLNHKDDRHVQTRLDYMLLYRSEGKAKIIRTLESWTDTKYAEWYKGIADSKEQGSEPPTEDLWITMSYDQFSLFVYGTIKHDTIKQQVDELVALKHIQRRPHPEYPYGPPQYLLNRGLVQEALDNLEIPANLFDLVPVFVSPRKKPTPQETYPQGGGKKPTRDPGKIPPPTGETSHPSNNLSKNYSESTKNGGYVAPAIAAPTPAPALSQSEIAAQIRSRIPQGDAILLERLGNGSHRIYRKSGRSIGELIPVGINVSEGLLELITVDAALSQETQEEPVKELSPARQEHREAREQVDALLDDTEGRLKAIRLANDTTESVSQEESMISPTITVGSIIIHKDDPDERRTGKVREINSNNGQALVLWFGTHVPHWSSLEEMILFSEWCAAHQTRQTQHTGVPGRKSYPKPEPPAQPSAPAPRDFRTGVLPRRPKVQPTLTAQPLFPSTKQSTRPQFTPVGKQVLEWYELIRAMKVRRTNENINACNGLSEEDGISFENLKRAIEHWEKDKYVKSHGIAIDLQQLEKPSGSFTFAKAMLVMPREQARNETKEDDNNIQDWTEASQRKIAEEEASGERQRKYQAALKLLEETRLRDQAKANS